MKRYEVLTLHPELVTGPLTGSILGRARERGLIDVVVRDIRDHAEGRHKQVDDAPYGGGAGMVMKVDVVARAVRAARGEGTRVVLTGAAGTPFTQATARRLLEVDHLVVVCGHYEGVDARVESVVDEVISLGDFVLTGGEIAACAIVDAVARLVPGVLGNDASPQDESFSDGLLEYPQYTRPRTWEGLEVPEVLVSGHHERVAAWRRARSRELTALRRPDLWAAWCARTGRAVDADPSKE